MTLKQKIEHNFGKIKKKDLISHIGESFFAPVEENGSVWQLRRTNLQRDNGRTLNIIDEIEVQAAEERKQQEIEEAKDMTFDDFKLRFLAHIEQTAPNDREAIESNDENVDAINKSAKPGTMSKRGTEMNDANKTSTSRQLNETGSVDDNEQNRSRLSRRSNQKSQLEMRGGSKLEEDGLSKFDIPESCYLTMMKKILIEKLESKFFLAVHPYPRIEGEMIIIKPQKED